MRRIRLLIILVLLVLVLPASPVHAGGVITVCDEAHLLAALAGGGTVTFACSGTITLTAEIVISADTTVDGTGQTVTISGNNAVRVFTVNPGIALNLNWLSVANGYVAGPGGAVVSNGGTVIATHCAFSDNSAYDGGGIWNSNGTLTVSHSAFSHNSATDISGGGIWNSNGTLTVNNSTFSDNRAGDGGGIYNAGGTVNIGNSTFSYNYADWYLGGGIYNHWGSMTVSASTFSANTSYYGGGILNGDGGWLTVSNSTFSGNRAYWDGGDGGAILNWNMLTVNGSTFAGNSALYGGGIRSFADNVVVSNSTFSGNSANLAGGALYNTGTVTVTNTTFSGNSARYGGSIAGGHILQKNTLVTNSLMGENCLATITDGGGNLSYPDTTCPGINADPKLGPLRYNLGPTQTMALGPDSAAIDTGIDAICAVAPVNGLDQRGVARPWGAHCDIGALEQVPIKSMWLPAILAR